ncbi:hypothetical protein MUBE_14215 [Mycobacterium uberis]|uniref:Uncharacterized protein n=1 Tax=Mycobacterium uberis TaxID=2162698 RepID=A0A3E1HCV3_9MYCO|nr:hypothetical protein [Mycobacterium uberis]RFD24216.1 hypothetical protein MUBE_14215 [Mycobacterium uberis]
MWPSNWARLPTPPVRSSGQCIGLITKLVALVVDAAFSAGDLYAVQNALPPRCKPVVSWNTNLATFNAIYVLAYG